GATGAPGYTVIRHTAKTIAMDLERRRLLRRIVRKLLAASNAVNSVPRGEDRPSRQRNDISTSMTKQTFLFVPETDIGIISYETLADRRAKSIPSVPGGSGPLLFA